MSGSKGVEWVAATLCIQHRFDATGLRGLIPEENPIQRIDKELLLKALQKTA